ncbi:hypothetical protein DUI87_23765 [Hirundo rustica rustica]|uniref:Integrase-type domain-containing protein n=1 Tax=Hirundo rustica rustica TaxID=333673 RepID=A0A3M0JL29_HIRRU|nr:hypothetical protein DUI87_23765 [Hirundo rustica rustica]
MFQESEERESEQEETGVYLVFGPRKDIGPEPIGAGVEHLCGDSEWVSALKQAQEVPLLPSEPFVAFVERLTSAIELQVKKGAQEQVLEEMVRTNANEKAAILSLPMEPAPTLDDTLQQKSPDVIVKDPATRETKSPHDQVTWGRGYDYVSTPPGIKWVPAEWVKPFIRKSAKQPAEAP